MHRELTRTKGNRDEGMRKLIVIACFVLLSSAPAAATVGTADTFTRPDANSLGTAESGQAWVPMSLTSGQAWGIRAERAAFIPSGNKLVRYVRVDSGTATPSALRIKADVTLSPVSANVGLALNLGNKDRVFCKTERTPSSTQPYGFMSIGGKFDGGDEKSVLGTARSKFSAAEQLVLGGIYHVAFVRSGDVVTCSVTGVNPDGSVVDETVTYTLLPAQADGLTRTSAGLRMRYVVNSGTSNEDDGQSRWDNVVVSDGT